MDKELITLGFEILGFSDSERRLTSDISFMDADIIALSADNFYPDGNGWISFTSSSGGCYDVVTSKRFLDKMKHMEKELSNALNLGKTVFLFLTKEVPHLLATGSTSPRKNERNYSTIQKSNYDFLPVNIGSRTTAKGKRLHFSGLAVFKEFHEKFVSNLSYEMYLETNSATKIIYTGKDKSKILGHVVKKGEGHLVVLPKFTYSYDDFVEYDSDGENEKWTKKAIKFGEELLKCLLNIDKHLGLKSSQTPPPEWVSNRQYISKAERQIRKDIEDCTTEIERLKDRVISLENELKNDEKLKDLLFENGKLLEDSVTTALRLIGYEAEGFDDGTLELDHVIISPEGNRFIGECEGKDSKDINITKFRQLLESLNADFERDEVDEKAFGILFGNPQRFTEPKARDLDFTDKCKIGAKREQIALVKTTDLYRVAMYLKEHRDEVFKSKCREAIFKGLGKVVRFPKIPKTT